MNETALESYRNEFPVTQKFIYLDHAGVAPMPLRVKNAITRFLGESAEDGAFSYPAWLKRLDDVRRSCSRLINAEPDEIAFVKSTSHGLSIVAEGLDWRPGDNVLVYEREFPSNLYPWLNLQRKEVEVKFIPSRGGRVLIDDIERLIDSKTRLLAISAVQFSNGFRIDLDRAGELCKQKNILFCIDAIQSLGLIPMDVRKASVDFLSADAHKWLLGPQGIGIFYCRRGLAERLAPPLVGWKSVQNEFAFDRPDFSLKTSALRFEEGSLNLLGIFGLGAAVELLTEVGISNIEARVLGLGEVIIREADQRGLAVLTPREKGGRGGNVTIACGSDPAGLQSRLRAKRIMVNARGGGLRVSPHFYNTDDEIAAFFQAL
jgi:selenocysteine lyase/cysteine desulfurase